MAKKNKSMPNFRTDMPSGINIMGMGGSGEKSYKETASPAKQIDTHQLMKGNAQKGQ